MKAAFINKTGSADEINIGDLPVPEIGDNDVLIKVEYVSINHVDTFVRSGAFKTKMNFPFVIGRDAVGVIEKCGANIKNFSIGQRVWTNSMGYDGRNGVTSEFAAIPADRTYSVPENVDPKQLVASVHSSATAFILLTNVLRIKSGNKILVEGAAGHVCSKLVEIGKSLGLQVSTTSNPKDFTFLKKIGASNVFDYHQGLDKIAGTYDYIVDTSGKVDLSNNLSKLNLSGMVALITAPANNQFNFDVRDFYMNLKQIKGFVISHATLGQLSKAAEFLNHYFSEGKLLNDDLLELSLTDAQEGQKMLENNEKHTKKLILKI
ncbi:alcohol dehydrogenase catalytic domain-containing protein [Companilactobacillus sp.]|uniref:quinone oxidoreductase family protein n=1 Tax=Companilactobacillus sp. TaxID=2767905 RepID=UPI00260C18BD|nr:alcohol dehydrogenase catalytic domain-containing protein [Companilactobacillus sp.]